jgi:hypothetical protein
MNAKLATQLLSQSTAKMIRYAIADESVMLSLHIKGMYSHVADLCEHWNAAIEICNGRDGPHSPDNAAMRQSCLLDNLVWFAKWKELHDERVRMKLTTEFIFFAGETLFCIMHQVIVAGSHHGNSNLLCVKGPVCQPTNNEHRQSGVVFWRCPTDGGRQHQQVNRSRVRPSGQEGEHFQCRKILTSWQ